MFQSDDNLGTIVADSVGVQQYVCIVMSGLLACLFP